MTILSRIAALKALADAAPDPDCFNEIACKSQSLLFGDVPAVLVECEAVFRYVLGIESQIGPNDTIVGPHEGVKLRLKAALSKLRTKGTPS